MFAGMIFIKHPFFHGRDNYDQLVRIAKVLGTDQLVAYLEKYELTLESYYDGVLGRHKPRPYSKFVTDTNRHLCPPEALDFLDKLLRYDPVERLTTKEAMAHEYFDTVRRDSGAAAAASDAEMKAATDDTD